MKTYFLTNPCIFLPKIILPIRRHGKNSSLDLKEFLNLSEYLLVYLAFLTCSCHVLPMFCACSFKCWTGNSRIHMNNLLSFCWLVDARISASEKDLTLSKVTEICLTFSWKNLIVVSDKASKIISLSL